MYAAPKVKFKESDYVCEQVFYPSKDGTKIPLFITYKKGLKRNGKNPVFLYGYGGFNVPLTPYFSSVRIPFIEMVESMLKHPYEVVASMVRNGT